MSVTASKVQFQSKLARMIYNGQSMQDYIEPFKEIFNCLSAMKGEVPEGAHVAMVLASSGDKNRSPFGHVKVSLATIQDKLDWVAATVSFLEEYENQFLRAGGPKGRKSSD